MIVMQLMNILLSATRDESRACGTPLIMIVSIIGPNAPKF